jgi:hypothetical protein
MGNQRNGTNNNNDNNNNIRWKLVTVITVIHD